MATITDAAMLRLMQLSSPSLPVGTYAFSFGLEKAVEDGWVKDLQTLEQWLADQIQFSLARVDIPIMLRLHRAYSKEDIDQVRIWNDTVLACRESAELRLSDTAPASALMRTLSEFGIKAPELEEYSFLTLFCQAAVHWSVPERSTVLAYLWSWLENQVIAATKLMPLGQTQAQILLGELQAHLLVQVEEAEEISDDEIGSCLPALAIISSLHETQYSRLFRS